MKKYALLMRFAHDGKLTNYLFLDNCRVHYNARLAAELLLISGTVLFFLPKNTTHFSQPLDVFVIATVKNIMRSKFKAYVDKANVAGIEVDKSAVIEFTLAALCDEGVRRSIGPSFVSVGMHDGVKINAERFRETFTRKALGDMTESKRKAPVMRSVHKQQLALALADAKAVQQRVEVKAAEVVNATHANLVAVTPLRKGTVIDGLSIVAGTIVTADARLTKLIALQEAVVDRAADALAKGYRKCRVCSVLMKANADKAKWHVCACAEYMMCQKCVKHHAPPNHCDVARPIDVIDERHLLAQRADLQNADAQLAKLKADKADLASHQHKAASDKRPKLTVRAQIRKARRGAGAAIAAIDAGYAPDGAVRLTLAPVAAADAASVQSGAVLLAKKRKKAEADGAQGKRAKKAPAKRKRAVDDDDVDDDDDDVDRDADVDDKVGEEDDDDEHEDAASGADDDDVDDAGSSSSDSNADADNSDVVAMRNASRLSDRRQRIDAPWKAVRGSSDAQSQRQ